jgi:hypothetical protein
VAPALVHQLDADLAPLDDEHGVAAVAARQHSCATTDVAAPAACATWSTSPSSRAPKSRVSRRSSRGEGNSRASLLEPLGRHEWSPLIRKRPDWPDSVPPCGILEPDHSGRAQGSRMGPARVKRYRTLIHSFLVLYAPCPCPFGTRRSWWTSRWPAA